MRVAGLNPTERDIAARRELIRKFDSDGERSSYNCGVLSCCLTPFVSQYTQRDVLLKLR